MEYRSLTYQIRKLNPNPVMGKIQNITELTATKVQELMSVMSESGVEHGLTIECCLKNLFKQQLDPKFPLRNCPTPLT